MLPTLVLAIVATPSASAQVDECEDAIRVAGEQVQEARKMWFRPSMQEELVFVIDRLMARCPKTADQAMLLFWRGDLYLRLRRTEEAAEDFDAVASSTSADRCPAAQSAMRLWSCLDDARFDGRDPRFCTSTPVRYERLPTPPPVRISLGPEAARALALAEFVERECAAAPELVLWRVARIHLRYSHEQELDRVLCKLAISYPDSYAGEKAALMLAETKTTCGFE